MTIRFAVQAAVVGIFLLLFIGFLELGRTILLPIVSAIIIGSVLGPLSKRADEYRIPRAVFATAVVALLFAAMYLGFVVLSEPIMEAVNNAPRIVEAVRKRLQELEDNFAAVRYLQTLIASADARLNIDFGAFIKPILAFATPALGQVVIFFATLFLFLLDQNDLRRKLILVFPGRDARLRAIQILNDINGSLVRYLGTVTVINLGVGIVTGVGFYFLQVPNPLFWGAAAFICNFLPYIGPTIIVVAVSIMGLLTFPTIGYALVAPAFFVVLTTIEGHVITPNVIGHSFKTSAFAVFLALSFWTWLWGPVGAFLSVPMLIIGSVIVTHLQPAKGVELPE